MKRKHIGESHYRLIRTKNGLRIEKIYHSTEKGGAE